MIIKRKDFQKAAAFLREFLLKLNEDVECAELRDCVNLALLHMQKYYRTLQTRTHEKSVHHSLSLSARGLSPLTPFVDAPDKFQSRWINLDSTRLTSSMPIDDSVNFVVLPQIIQATKQGDIKHILQLIQKDAECVDECDALGRTALFYAVHFHQLDALKILLQNEAETNISAHDGSTSVHQACHDNNPMALHILLSFGGDLSLEDCQGRAPIHWAVTTTTLDCLRLLLQYKADIHVRDKDGATPSMWACRLDHISHFDLLSQWDDTRPGGDIERDNSGKTWMHWSIRRTEPLECLQTLLTADTATIQDDEGKTVLLSAAEQGSLPACKIILDIAGKTRLSDCDDQSRTPLHLASIGGHGDVVNYLLEKGADLNAVDKHEATAWDYARNRQLHYCQLILMSHQRQSVERSNPSTPNGFGSSLLDNQRFLNGDINMDDENDNFMQIYRNDSIKPVTPPHPPKRPRTSGRTPITPRRANSMTMSPLNSRQNSVEETDREVVSAGNERRKGRIEVSVPSRNIDGFPLQIRSETFMSLDSSAVSDRGFDVPEDDVDRVSVGGMDVSDIDDNDDEPPTVREVHRSTISTPQSSGTLSASMTPRPPNTQSPTKRRAPHPSPERQPNYAQPLQPQYISHPADEYIDGPTHMAEMAISASSSKHSNTQAQMTSLTRPTLTRKQAQMDGPVEAMRLIPTPPEKSAFHRGSSLMNATMQYSGRDDDDDHVLSPADHVHDANSGSVMHVPSPPPRKQTPPIQQNNSHASYIDQASRDMVHEYVRHSPTQSQLRHAPSPPPRQQSLVGGPLPWDSSHLQQSAASRPLSRPGSGPSLIELATGSVRPGSGSSVRSLQTDDLDGYGGPAGSSWQSSTQRTHPPGVLEGKKIPPPVLTPLRNAPKPPTVDNAGDRPRHKRHKKRRKAAVASSNSMSPQVPPVESDHILYPPPGVISQRQHRTGSTVPPPHASKSGPQKHEPRSEESWDDEFAPVISGHALSIKEVTGRGSARPRERRQPIENEKAGSSELPNQSVIVEVEEGAELNDDEDEQDDGEIGPLIPPPQAFRGSSSHPHGRALSHSVPQDSRTSSSHHYHRPNPGSAKPPIPKPRRDQSGNGVMASSAYRRGARGRPYTGRSTNY